MDFRKASLLLYFLLFLHLQHHFLHAISRSTTPLVSADPNHDDLPVHSLESKPDGDAFVGKTAELAVVIHKGGGGGRGGGGGGGRSFGGGGRSFGGGGRSFGGGGRGKGGKGGKARGGVVPFIGGAAGGGAAGAAAHHGGHRSSAGRESVSVWLGLSALFGLVFGF